MAEASKRSPGQFELWVLWGVLLISLGIYGAVPFFSGLVAPPASEPNGEFRAFLVRALALAALATAIGIFAIRHFLLVRPARAGELDIRSQRGMTRLFIVSMLTWTLSESIGVYGLVLYFLFRAPTLLYSFLAAAALLIVLQAPRPASLQRRSPSDLARPDVKIGS